jgi:DNA-binding NarL/FixJ family response regulator
MLAHVSRIRISIVEDDEKTREVLRALFNTTPGYECLTAHASTEDALAHLPLETCQVVLLDLSLPKASGIACARELKRRKPDILILVLTVHEDNEHIFQSLRAGASGYLLKRTPMAQLLASIEELLAGGSPMSPAIARRVTEHFQNPGARPPSLPHLTARESEVLELIARGRINKEIATQLRISPHTVGNHIRSIYEKMSVNTRAEATARYLKP